MATLTVFFDAPWWVGVVEVEAEGRLRARRTVFGSEPADAEVYAFVQHSLAALMAEDGGEVQVDVAPPRKVNPKRQQREAARLVQSEGVSTQAQAALKAIQEAQHKERQVVSREERERRKETKREKAREKARARHRGR